MQRMRRAFGTICAWLLGVANVGACTGPQGAMGKPGTDGSPGMSGPPSISAVTPPYAFLGRTVDVAIAGSGTSWSSKTTVSFADPTVKVNQVTAASATGLLVNVTVPAGATVAPTDVTVTDGAATEVYKGAFTIRAPLAVTTDQTSGVPQGGFANVHVQMFDLTTPFDPTTVTATLSATDVALAGAPNATDYALDFLVGADVLAMAGESVDLVVSSGPKGSSIDSPAKAAFKIAARTATTLAAGTPGSGMIATTSDSTLYAFTPSGAASRFVQFQVSSPEMGGVLGIAIPKSGKQMDALGGFGVRFGLGTKSTDPTYVVVTDGGNPLANPPPYGFALSAVETACTVVNPSGIHTNPMSAFALVALPALAQSDFGNGSNTAGDWYGITVAGAPKTIHAATGGDGRSDMTITVYGPDGTTVLAASTEDDAHKDVVAPAATDGTYYIAATAGMQFDPMHSTYDLFVEVK